MKMNRGEIIQNATRYAGQPARKTTRKIRHQALPNAFSNLLLVLLLQLYLDWNAPRPRSQKAVRREDRCAARGRVTPHTSCVVRIVMQHHEEYFEQVYSANNEARLCTGRSILLPLICCMIHL
jgi:hypothetical protein